MTRTYVWISNLSRQRRVLGAVAALSLGDIASQVAGAALLAILARALTPTSFGQFSYILVTGTLVGTIAIGGIPAAMTRAIAMGSDSTAWMRILKGVLAAVGIFLIVAITASLLLFHDPFMVALIAIATVVGSVYSSILRGRRAFQPLSTFNLSTNISRLLLVIPTLLLPAEARVVSAALAYFGATWITIAAFHLIVLKDYAAPQAASARAPIAPVLAFAATIWVSIVAFALLTSIPILLLRETGDLVAVGEYAIARTFLTLSAFVPAASSTVFMPMVASAGTDSDRRRLLQVSLAISVVSATIVGVGFWLAGASAIHLIYGPGHHLAADILRILSLGGVLLATRNSFAAFWEGGGFPIIATIEVVAAAACVIGLSLWLPISMGTIGYAWAFTIGFVPSILLNIAAFASRGRLWDRANTPS